MAKTRKKKKTGTADAIHIDINSHNAKDHAKYRMMDEKSRHLTYNDIYDGARFSYAGIIYEISEIGGDHIITSNSGNTYNGDIVKATKTGIEIERRFFNKTVKTTLKFKDLYFVA